MLTKMIARWQRDVATSLETSGLRPVMIWGAIVLLCLHYFMVMWKTDPGMMRYIGLWGVYLAAMALAHKLGSLAEGPLTTVRYDKVLEVSGIISYLFLAAYSVVKVVAFSEGQPFEPGLGEALFVIPCLVVCFFSGSGYD